MDQKAAHTCGRGGYLALGVDPKEVHSLDYSSGCILARWKDLRAAEIRIDLEGAHLAAHTKGCRTDCILCAEVGQAGVHIGVAREIQTGQEGDQKVTGTDCSTTLYAFIEVGV